MPGGLDIEKLTKPPMVYRGSYFDLVWGGLVLCLGGISPPKPPVATGLIPTLVDKQRAFFRGLLFLAFQKKSEMDAAYAAGELRSSPK